MLNVISGDFLEAAENISSFCLLEVKTAGADDNNSFLIQNTAWAWIKMQQLLARECYNLQLLTYTPPVWAFVLRPEPRNIVFII